MTKDRESGTTDRGAASEQERGRESAGIAGNLKEKGEDPSPDDRGRGESPSAGDCAAIDLDTAHDRAS